MEKLSKKVETPKREETKQLQNQAKLEQRETKQVFATQNTQEKKEVVKSETKQSEQSENFYEKLYSYVREWEWSFQAQAFCDSYYNTETGLIRKSAKDCTYWSIWFGTKSFQWEVITYEEAVRRKIDDLKRREQYIKSDCLTESQKIVVLDFFYQHGVNSSNMQWKVNNCRINDIYYTIVNWRDYYKSKQQWWMVKREQKRINYFYNN